MTEPLPRMPGGHVEGPASGSRPWVKVLGSALWVTVVATSLTLAVIGLLIVAFVVFLASSGSLMGNK